MVRLLMIASLVGAGGVSGLSSAGDINLLQMSKTTDTNASRKSSMVTTWLCMLKSDVTDAQVQSLCQGLQNPLCTGAPVATVGLLTDSEKTALISTGLTVSCEADPFAQKAWERVTPADETGDRTP